MHTTQPHLPTAIPSTWLRRDCPLWHLKNGCCRHDRYRPAFVRLLMKSRVRNWRFLDKKQAAFGCHVLVGQFIHLFRPHTYKHLVNNMQNLGGYVIGRGRQHQSDAKRQLYSLTGCLQLCPPVARPMDVKLAATVDQCIMRCYEVTYTPDSNTHNEASTQPPQCKHHGNMQSYSYRPFYSDDDDDDGGAGGAPGSLSR